MCTDLSARFFILLAQCVPSGWNNVFHLDEASGFNMLKLIRILIFRVYRQL